MNFQYFKNLLRNYNFTDGVVQINYLKLPVNYVLLNRPIGAYADGAEFANDLISHLYEIDEPNVVWTKSGGISTAKDNLKPITYAWVIEKNTVDLIVIINKQGAKFRIAMDTMAPSREKGDDRKSFELFNAAMDVFDMLGVDVWAHAVTSEEGKRIVDEEIESPWKKIGYRVRTGPDAIYYHVHHMDLNSAWAACACAVYPDLRPAFQYMFDRRKTEPEKNYKAVMNIFLGYAMSYHKPVSYRLANIAKAARNGCNEILAQMALKLNAAGFEVLLYNTDGIWYRAKDGSDRVYHDEDEGTELGQWKNDHIDCTFCIKNAVAYEYIENGEYKVVMSGTCNYERKVKPRAQWVWHDLFEQGTEVESYGWRLNRGVLEFYRGEVDYE